MAKPRTSDPPTCPECGARRMHDASMGRTKMWACAKCGLVVLAEGSKVHSAGAALLLELCGTEELKRQLREERARRAAASE